MPLTKLQPKTLEVFFRDRVEFAQLLRHAITHAEICLRNGHPEERYAALAPHHIYFSQAETPLDWLDLLWVSTESLPGITRSPQRLALLEILKRVIGELPARPVAPQRFTALTICRFVRQQEATELLPALRARAFGPGPWVSDPELRAALLLAVYPNIYSPSAFEFLDQFASHENLLKELDFSQFSVFCAEYITSAALRLNQVGEGGLDDDLLHRLHELEKQALYTVERPAPLVERPEGFGAADCKVIDEVSGMELPDAFRASIELLRNRLNDAVNGLDAHSEMLKFVKRLKDSKAARAFESAQRTHQT